ncbi:uncharacterized protein LOC119687784 [Teleopsis dalmanni]|uniref:uncharacterized protein LOC119687784 n=1 Tax=Teleopsis dalmanni TaxID=139649 RepID=UPI0018CD6F70|nr:uncharacterized protein LOC119687784 [Teleopsis dalmanni]
MDMYVNSDSQNLGDVSHGKEKQSHASRQAFGELKNVIRNSATPCTNIGLNNDKDKIGMEKNNFKKPMPSHAPSKDVNGIKTPRLKELVDNHSNEFDEGFIDSIDFNHFNGCEKSDQEIWSEMGALEDSFINKLIEGVKETMNSNDDEKHFEDDFTDLMDIYTNSLMPNLKQIDGEHEASANLYQQIEIPDLSLSDDDLPFLDD